VPTNMVGWIGYRGRVGIRSKGTRHSATLTSNNVVDLQSNLK